MSEKRLRFTMESDKLYSCIFDNGNELTCFELVDLLNEQQATIEQLRKLNNAYAEKFAKIVNLISEDVVIDDE